MYCTLNVIQFHDLYIFRVTGLLRSGAMKHADKPLWYDVYASFPPHKPDTKSNQEKKAPINILYKEDMIRA